MSHRHRALNRAAARARIVVVVASGFALLPLACAAPGPLDDAPEERTGAWAQDLDGNPVGPDLSGTGGASGGGGAAGSSGGSACSGGAAANLLAAASFDYADHGEHTLTDGSFTLFLCIVHFPVGSPARAEVQKAVDLYNAVAGTSASIALSASVHQDIPELFPDDPDASYMDVVDNSALGFPCHAAGDTSPSSWALNTCRHGDGSGGVWNSGSKTINHFVISVNPVAYPLVDPTSSDYPPVTSVLHELAHGFGMSHTPDWAPASGQGLLSVMQGKLPMIPAHNRAYLRHFYPGTASSTLNLVASPEVRVPAPALDVGFKNLAFADANPKELYVGPDGNYRDCATRLAPIFQAQWLDNGQVATSCTVNNRFRIGPAGSEGAASKVTVKAWLAAKMPAASQDRIASTVTIPEATLSSLNKDVAYELTFKVDRDGAYPETDESDNVVTSTVTLRGGYFLCDGVVSMNPL